jgi:hypothetical protein
VGNTDAEGRMAMVDPLCEAKEIALNEVNPFLFTVATLTGHVIRAYGEDYTVNMTTHLFKAKNIIFKLKHKFVCRLLFVTDHREPSKLTNSFKMPVT